MTSFFSTIMPKSKPSWQIIGPLVLVVLIAVGWSVYWSKAKEILEQVLAREKARGLTITCGRKRIRGYPFKFQLTCDKLKIVRETPTRQTSLTARRFVAVVRAYDFNHIIGELDGPFEITRGRKRDPGATVVEVRKLFSGNAETVRSSLILENRSLKDATLIIRGLSGSLVDYSIKNAPQNIATSLTQAVITLRTTQDTANPIGAYEGAGVFKGLSLVGGSANIQSDKGLRLDDFRARMKISNAPYRITGKPLDWLKVWKANDGEARITELSATSGALKLTGTGQFKLDALGRAHGVLNTKITGLNGIVKELVANGRIRRQDAELGLAAINLLGNTGTGGVKVALRAQKGNVYFGPFKIAVLKPLFAQ